jgi:hypothetical protein
MTKHLTAIHPYFELLYFLSGIGLVFIAAYGLRQLRLMKSDTTIRSERAAKEKAIEAASTYMRTFVPLYDRFSNECDKAEIDVYDGPIGDFSKGSLPPRLLKDIQKRFEMSSWLPALNLLEIIAAAYVTGVADERTGFMIVGRTYCGSVASVYDILSLVRAGGTAHPYYSNIVRLYQIWSPRLSKSELAATREVIDRRIAAIADSRIPVLGEDALT